MRRTNGHTDVTKQIVGIRMFFERRVKAILLFVTMSMFSVDWTVVDVSVQQKYFRSSFCYYYYYYYYYYYIFFLIFGTLLIILFPFLFC